MFGIYDTAKFATAEHLSAVYDTIKELRRRHDLFDGDIEFEHSWAIYPAVEEMALEYLEVLRTIPQLPHFLINFNADEFQFHWYLTKRPNPISLYTTMYWDKETGRREYWYQELDSTKATGNYIIKDYVVNELKPENFGDILDRLNNPQIS